jgi:hypothetical protein
MNKPKKNFGQDDDTRTLLKNLHKKVYSICRLFTNNYAAHQSLFKNAIAAAAQNLRPNSTEEDKQSLFLRACINMTALHAISANLIPDADPRIQFKSPDYQKSMLNFREVVGKAEDYEKIMFFLNFEKWPPERTEELSGLSPLRAGIHPAFRTDPDTRITPAQQPDAAAPVHPALQKSRPHFTPPLKEQLIWM